MTKQLFQLPMQKSSLKYLGVITLFKGLRVYTRAAMGMPGSTEHLDELMSRVIGDLMHAGKVIKIADDLYTGGNSIDELLLNWEHILQRFLKNNLRLSATKTVVCPVTTTILGWVWSSGRIQASPHKITPLLKSPLPWTVKALRSWCGAFKHLKACIPQYSHLLSPLETATAGQDSSSIINWTEELSSHFSAAQKSLNDIKAIVIPSPSDILIITTDGASSNGGIGSILYVLRDGVMHVGGFFSARLKQHQVNWLPCEIEALAISASINHWSPYILESTNTVQILSDSRPCVQAYDRLCRGQFSSSARVSTFLSALSCYKVSLQHISGAANLPADYHSRHPMECDTQDCQICRFIHNSATVTVHKLCISDILDGKFNMPFLSRTAWKATQDCPSLRRTYAHLAQGTRPNRKNTTIKLVKRYLRVATLSPDGLLVVKKDIPFTQTRSLIIVPQHALAGLLNALHFKLQHPRKTQLSAICHRYFFALDMDKEIAAITSHCPQCAAIASLPHELEEFSTTPSPCYPGVQFACDILCRARQRILLIRDCFSSFTATRLIPNEQAISLRAAIIETIAELKDASGCIIRVDGASAFSSLAKDRVLDSLNISLEIGRIKNKNKNPIAEKAIQELEKELKRAYPEGGPITPPQLALVTATLNTRVRDRGLAAKEILFQRDSYTSDQLNISDKALADSQFANRQANHLYSARSKAPNAWPAAKANVKVGDLVFVKQDGNKHTTQEKFLVTALNQDRLWARKLTDSQFCAKTYELKYCDVYLVPTSQVPLCPNKSSDPYASDTSSDDVSIPLTTDPHTF